MCIRDRGTGIGILITVLTCLIKITKNTKVRKTAEKMLLLTNQIAVFVTEAESFKNYTGSEKKNYVLTKMNQFSIENKIKYDEEYITKQLEELINTTKKVNTSRNTIKKDWLE